MSHNYLDRRPIIERRAIDYAPFRRQLTPSLRPSSVLGPAAVILLLAAAGALIVLVYSLTVTP